MTNDGRVVCGCLGLKRDISFLFVSSCLLRRQCLFQHLLRLVVVVFEVLYNAFPCAFACVSCLRFPYAVDLLGRQTSSDVVVMGSILMRIAANLDTLTTIPS